MIINIFKAFWCNVKVVLAAVLAVVAAGSWRMVQVYCQLTHSAALLRNASQRLVNMLLF
jgi:hypothetical protein